MHVTENPLVMLIEEAIHLRDSAQEILSVTLGGPALSRLEGLVLLAIIEAGHPLTAPQVGRNLGHSRQVIQRIANQLVDLGLLRKLPNPDHKTAALLEATDTGKVLHENTGRAMLATVNTLFSEQDQMKCLQLSRDLRKIRSIIESWHTDSEASALQAAITKT
ncbi:helix-turn-helix domain-containing protein [Pseudomaricurvus sp. HS19]|uniref:MarR family transcriptional regulator n=1 Tax=Pseudomaricurvus sp. HS19 TaxID=2692626 RepID=UPI00136B4FED|nr:helix-turn-helix domain-containing protein [Pseudomaricurvus sp. HS19]MYM63119.1 MarR family transcriptional regulator [Pseudomaricurvus sp. HS19]